MGRRTFTWTVPSARLSTSGRAVRTGNVPRRAKNIGVARALCRAGV